MRSFRSRSQSLLQWLSTGPGLVTLFAAGFLIRVGVSFNTGHVGDLKLQQGWATQLAAHGPGNFFKPGFLEHPPDYYYFYFGYSPVLFLIGEFSKHVLHEAPPYVLLKLPAMVADLGLAAVATFVATRLSPGMHDRGIRALAAGAVLLNPAFIFLSAVWGQVDSVAALMVVGSLALFGTGSTSLRAEIGGAALLGLAVCTKPESILVLPVVALVLLFRHLRGGEPVLGVMRVVGLGIVAFSAFVIPGVPYGLAPWEMVEYLRVSLGQVVHVLSVSAFNFWAVLGFYKGDAGGPGEPRVLGLAPHDVGIAAFVAGSAIIGIWMVRRLRGDENEGRVLFAGAAAVTCLGFAVLTRIHERYLFLALACLVPLIGQRSFRRVLAVLSGLFVLNLYLSYTLTVFDKKPTGFRVEPFYSWVYGTELGTPQQKVMGGLVGLLCVLVVWRGGRWLAGWEGRSGPSESVETVDSCQVTDDPRARG